MKKNNEESILTNIANTAKIYNLQNNSGETRSETFVTKENYARQKKGEGATPHYLIFPKLYKYFFTLDGAPLRWSEMKNFSRKFACTKGHYTLKKLTPDDPRYNPHTPYQIGQDMVLMKLCVSGPKHWKKLASEVPEFSFIYNNSTMTKDWFKVADIFPGIAIPFSVDPVKFLKAEESKAKPFLEACTNEEEKEDFVYYSYRKRWNEEEERIKTLPNFKTSQRELKKTVNEIIRSDEFQNETKLIRQKFGPNIVNSIVLETKSRTTGTILAKKTLKKGV